MKYLFVIAVLLLYSCQKEEVEESLNFDIDASAVVINPSNTYDFNVILKSKMPQAGISIEITAVEEVSGQVVLPQVPLLTTTQNTTKTLVKSLPRQKWVLVTVKVTSIKVNTNTSFKTFRVIYK